jgi:hypothetical protein
VEHLGVDEMGHVEIAVAGKAPGQPWSRIGCRQDIEYSRSVDDQHESATVAAVTNRGDDRLGVRAAGTGAGACKHVGDRRVAGNAFKLAQREV